MEPRLVIFKEEPMKSAAAIGAHVFELKYRREIENNTGNVP